MNSWKNPELEKLRQCYFDIINECKQLTVDLTDEEINKRSQPGKWSIAECIQHITLTNNKNYDKALHAIEKGKEMEKFSNDPIKLSFIGKMFFKLEPPPKRRYKSPKLYFPINSNQELFKKEKVVGDFIDSKMKMIELMEKADGLNLNKIKLHSPVTSLVRTRLGDYFTTMAPHDRRHLWQVAQIKNSPGFKKV